MADAAKAETDLLEIVTAGLSAALFNFYFLGAAGWVEWIVHITLKKEREKDDSLSVSLT